MDYSCQANFKSLLIHFVHYGAKTPQQHALHNAIALAVIFKAVLTWCTAIISVGDLQQIGWSTKPKTIKKT